MATREESVQEWTLDGVLDELAKIHRTMADRQFAFILGAGASFTSGIPTGHHLAQKWLQDLHLRECADGRPLEKWLKGCGIGDGSLTWETAAEQYPYIFERRFEGDREAGYAELESAMEGKSPSLGYSLLAEIIQHTRHKVVVTTNFDNLVADALAMHAHQSPLVVAHESLAGFVRPQLRRPLVAKIHRDLFLHPINDAAGVSTMERSWTIALKKLFQYFTPIVVGYGGNDGSLMELLAGLDQGDIAGRMVWCYRDGAHPPLRAQAVLRKHRGVQVKIAGFDEFMLQLAAKLVSEFDVAAIAERTAKLGEERAGRYREQAKKLQESSARGTPAEQKAGTVLSQSLRLRTSWWTWEMKAQAELDIEQRDRVYLEGLQQFPASASLTGNYALFLKNQRKDNDAAEAMYRKALELDPNHANNIGNYAVFLKNQRKDYDAAEAMYKKALEVDPGHASNTGNYAIFLVNQRKDNDAAEAMYKKALEIDPRHASNTGNYAIFLANQRKDYDAAEAMYKRALELDPNYASGTRNYAIFLKNQRKDYDAAEAMYKKAIELAPRDTNIICSYAIFLANQRKDFDAAEAMYKKALELDPSDANNTRNYAIFLKNHRKEYDAAATMYERALELDPTDGNNMRDYGVFLASQNKDYNSAEVMFKKALEVDPNDASYIGSYSIFLAHKRKNFDMAEAMFAKVIELDPRNANNTSNYASVLLARGDDVSIRRVLPLVRQVLEISQADLTQTVAEALLYGALVQELVPDQVHATMLSRLKHALHVGYVRGSWDFAPMFSTILPRLEETRRTLFQALGDAILDSDRLAALDEIESWRTLEPVDTFAPFPEA